MFEIGILKKLQENIQEEILYNFSLKNTNSFKVGGKVRALINLTNTEELSETVKFLNINKIPYYVLGSGTNVVFIGHDYFGCIVKLIGKKLIKIDENQENIKVWAGNKTVNVLSLAMEENLLGYQCLAGIPGSIGGALKMNAGIGASCISQLVEAIEFVNKNGDILLVQKKDLVFEYRALNNFKDYVISHVYLCKDKKDFDLKDKVSKLLEKRKKTQPQGLPNAGSVFKNPQNDYAARLIESVGLKGYALGGAQISSVHANFIVNTGLATGQDIENLMLFAAEKVYKVYNIKLKPEIKFLNAMAQELY